MSFRNFLSYAIVFIGIIFINTQIIQISYVPTESMDPTINAPSILINNRCGIKKINRYDVVTFKYNNVILIKRVIGLPGETIEIKDGQVFANGEKLRDDFTKEPMITKDEIYHIPNDKFFIMGDNRNNSADSRVIGYISHKDVIAKAIVQVYPKFKKI